ncbi:MAG: hypothetical protein U0798_03390 [Gemmataceae bacterium]
MTYIQLPTPFYSRSLAAQGVFSSKTPLTNDQQRRLAAIDFSTVKVWTTKWRVAYDLHFAMNRFDDFL